MFFAICSTVAVEENFYYQDNVDEYLVQSVLMIQQFVRNKGEWSFANRIIYFTGGRMLLTKSISYKSIY